MEQPFQLEDEDPQETNVLVFEIVWCGAEQLEHPVDITPHKYGDRDHGFIGNLLHGFPDHLVARLLDPDGEPVLYGPVNEDVSAPELGRQGVGEAVDEPGVERFFFLVVQVEDRIVKTRELPREINDDLQS